MGLNFRSAVQAAAREQGRYIGIGLAHAVKGTGRGPFETGIVRVNPSGRVSVYTGAAAMCQGLATALAQICADQLGLQPDQVSVTLGDTAFSPLGLGGFASWASTGDGRILGLCSRRAPSPPRRRSSPAICSKWPRRISSWRRAERCTWWARPELAVFARRAFCARAARRRAGIRFSARCRPCARSRHQMADGAPRLRQHVACRRGRGRSRPWPCHVRILRYIALQDCGTLINPMIVDGQIRGGIAHGIGNALLEEMVYDEPRRATADHDLGRLSASNLDGPAELRDASIDETPSPMQPARCQGEVGEVGTIPTAAAAVIFRDRGCIVAVRPAHPPDAGHAEGDVWIDPRREARDLQSKPGG